MNHDLYIVIKLGPTDQNADARDYAGIVADYATSAAGAESAYMAYDDGFGSFVRIDGTEWTAPNEAAEATQQLTCIDPEYERMVRAITAGGRAELSPVESVAQMQPPLIDAGTHLRRWLDEQRDDVTGRGYGD
jgi:hypothetical protein